MKYFNQNNGEGGGDSAAATSVENTGNIATTNDPNGVNPDTDADTDADTEPDVETVDSADLETEAPPAAETEAPKADQFLYSDAIDVPVKDVFAIAGLDANGGKVFLKQRNYDAVALESPGNMVALFSYDAENDAKGAKIDDVNVVDFICLSDNVNRNIAIKQIAKKAFSE